MKKEAAVKLARAVALLVDGEMAEEAGNVILAQIHRERDAASESYKHELRKLERWLEDHEDDGDRRKTIVDRAISLLKRTQYEEFPEANTRQFNYMLFLGNGDGSAKGARLLHERLQYGLSMMGGLQQGIPCDSDEYRKGMEAIYDVGLDLVSALGIKVDVNGWDELEHGEEQ